MASGQARASYVAELELDDPDGGGVVPWRIGMAPVGPVLWNELVAAHTVKEDAPAEVHAAAQEDFAGDVTGHTCLWEEYGDDPRTALDPGQVAGWPDTLPSDVWAVVVEEAYRVSGPSGWEWATQRLRRAPLLAVEMAVARTYRIPHSEFLRWAEDDRHLAIAHLLEERGACTGCGVPRRAMKDPDAAALEVDSCFWCTVLGQARREAGEDEHPRVAMKHGY